jgi:hypothetical protein
MLGFLMLLYGSDTLEEQIYRAYRRAYHGLRNWGGSQLGGVSKQGIAPHRALPTLKLWVSKLACSDGKDQKKRNIRCKVANKYYTFSY